MLTEKFFEVLKHEGAVSITSWADNEAHVTCTWNSYLVVKGKDTILIPAAGLKTTEMDVEKNDRVILTLATREVEGYNGYQGTGFRVEGNAAFLQDGPYYDEMKQKFPFLNRVLEVKVRVAKQLL